MKNLIKNILPRPAISNLQYATYFLKDVCISISGRRESMVPPTRMMFDGPRDIETFKKNGREFLDYFIRLANLKPDAKVLDVGCGIGRKTLPLTKYLTKEARYEGFDINRTHVDWCTKNITPTFPNFRFQIVDVYNKHYNPKGMIKASEFKFPFTDGSFDLVISGSVFTHLVPEDMKNYLPEISRVLRKGGKAFTTFFLLNQESLNSISEGRGTIDARYDFGLYRSDNVLTPEDVICIDESFVLDLHSRSALVIDEPISYGSWCGRQTFLSEQDIIVATKS